jgi:hypothetical protein
MTNMDMVGLAFVLVVIGIPVLCVVVIAGYLAHRSAMKKNQENGIPGPVNAGTPEMVLDLVARPDAFFKTVSEGPVDLFAPFLWLVVAGIVFSFGLMAGSNPFILQSGVVNVLFLNLLALVLMIPSIALAWIGASGVFYAISHLSGGSGSFRKTLQNTGYGLAPGLVLYGLILLLGALVLTVLQIPVTPFGDPVPGSMVLAMIVTGGSLIASIWSFVLMTLGLRYSGNLSLAKAAVSVGVPVLVFLIFSNLHSLAPA